MIIAHLADLHLGYRAYTRTTPAGVNQREEDVAAAVEAALRMVVAQRPDLVVVAGDVFHSVRPSNAAIAEAFRRFSYLSSQLPAVPVVVVAGDRDTPRSADTTSILELFREIPRVEVATREVERFRFASAGMEVLAVPHAAIPRAADAIPRAGAGEVVRVLVAHTGLARPGGGDPQMNPSGNGAGLLPAEAIDFAEWDYVALGHLSVATQVAENAWYAGSIERTAADIWLEADRPKGFLTYDTDARKGQFHEVPTRKVVDLPRISARGLDASQVSRAIEAILQEVPDGAEGWIVRLTITDISRSDLRQIDTGVLREARASALHFLLDARTVAADAARVATVAVRGVSLERQVEEYLTRVWEPTMAGVDRQRLIALAQQYLEAVGDGAES